MKSLSNFLQRASDTGTLYAATRAALQSISDNCDICTRSSTQPRRFKLTIGSEDLRFNSSVQIDTFFLNNRPVLHVVDEATHFSAAAFLRKQSAAEIWRSIQSIWTLIYLGPPDHIWVDQGSSYISKEMRSNLQASGVSLKEAPIESPGTIGIVERYHAPLRLAYERIRQEMKTTVPDQDCLGMAVFSMNSTVGPE